MGITKSQGQKNTFDKFYTKETVVQLCLSVLPDLSTYDCIIEPSAGGGAFSDCIPNCFAFDIAPEGNNIQQADWLTLDKTPFQKYSNLLIVGNPPFGQQNQLALKFISESSKIASTIAFILPLSFKKKSIQNKIDLSFSLVKEIDLPLDSFTLNGKSYKVPCVFQVWKKQSQPRKIVKWFTTTPLFNFVSKSEADFRVQRVGGNAGKASYELNFSDQSNYFIKNNHILTTQQLVDIINHLNFKELTYTVGPKSLSKGELIFELEEYCRIYNLWKRE